MADLIPPHDHEAELSILGSCLIDDTAYDTAASIVGVKHFYTPAHAVIFGCFAAITKRGEPLDIVTVTAELRSGETPRLNTVGSAQFIGELTDAAVTIAHLEAHCARVRNLWGVRQTIKDAAAIVASGYAVTDIAAFQADAARRILAATEVTNIAEPVRLDAAIEAAFLGIEKAMESPGRTTGFSTGLRDLDKMTTGLHPGELVVIGGRSGMGKTALMMQMVTAITEHGAGQVHQLEMTRVSLVNRMMASEARVDQTRMRANTLTKEDMAALSKGAERIYSLPLWIDDGPADIARIERAARKRKAERPDMKVLAVDHLTLVKMPKSERPDLEIGAVTKALKSLAKELEIVVILGVQINRAAVKNITGKGDNMRPKAHHLGESDKIQQDADLVILLYRDEIYNPQSEDRGIAELIIDKQRNGPFPETVRARFIRELTRFENLAADEREYPEPDSNYQEHDAA